jgi:predicted metal-dependent phosphoesterase TrpH
MYNCGIIYIAKGEKIANFRLKASLHIHTYHSDGIHTPTFIVGYAKLTGIKVLSITDHNEIKGSLAGARLANRLGLIFFPGIELTFHIKGKAYEMLAYFYESENLRRFYQAYRFNNGFLPSFDNVKEVIELINKFGGVDIVPHPFGRKGIYRRMRNRGLTAKGIEVRNAFTGEKRNHKARRHQNGDNHFLKLAAADMHFFISDITKVYTELTSEEEITKEAIWSTLNRKSDRVHFRPVGRKFSHCKIWFQKPLCGVVYVLNYPRLYLTYRIGKWQHVKNY